jgi:hypothetical protein
MLRFFYNSMLFFFMKTSKNKSNFFFTKVHFATSIVHNSFYLRG